ncbi:MAG: class I SAM-dependent methyltransferase [Thermoanaerobaculia bacterium]
MRPSLLRLLGFFLTSVAAAQRPTSRSSGTLTAEMLLSRIPPSAKPLVRRLLYMPSDALDRLLGRRPPLVPPRGLSDVGAGDFVKVGQQLLGLLRDCAGLVPSSSVLDVGCGIGRIAAALTGYLTPPGRYLGFDVRAADIRWCTRLISPSFPDFQFARVDVRSGEYNPGGAVEPEQFRFPFEDELFDVVIAASVFTHLLPAAAVCYLFEARRVLKPGGRLFATFFLLSEGTQAAISQGLTGFRFRPFTPPCFVVDPNRPESGVAYPREEVTGWMSSHGLPPVAVLQGEWSGLPGGASFQDVVVARKEASLEAGRPSSCAVFG